MMEGKRNHSVCPQELDPIIAAMMGTARVPGGAIAVVADGETIFAKGYGWRDLEAQLPMSADTVYPIASTTKAMNATLLGMLVDEGRIAWDTPVAEYLPSFQLRDSLASAQVTLRDLLIMRTGLPRHDWLWIENPMSRAELTSRLRFLKTSSGFRYHFHYNNLTATVAGHVAEVVMGQSWEDLIRARILEPLGMKDTSFSPPVGHNSTQSYHETIERTLKLSRRWATEVAAPSGGAIHSTVRDMARWVAFNLSGGKTANRQLIAPQTLQEIQAPQIPARTDPSSPTPDSMYAMGWFVDHHEGTRRLLHGGYLHDVNSEVTLFPDKRFGMVSFTNFGFVTLDRLIHQRLFDLASGTKSAKSVEEKLADYERRVSQMQLRHAAVPRVQGTQPSRALGAYEGSYRNPAYGTFEIRQSDTKLTLRRHRLFLCLQHWHYDVWIVQDPEGYFIHIPHAFDPTSRIAFESNLDGDIEAVLLPLEPASAPIRFERQ